MAKVRSIICGLLMLTGVFVVSVAAAQPPQGSAPRQLYAEPSPLARVIAGLEEVSQETRRELAILIVEALVAAYESELDRALSERMRDVAGQRKLSRWHQAAAPVLSELRMTQAALYIAREVQLHTDRHGQTLLLIDGRPLWVAWPRVTVQSRLEREVAAAFCQRHDCPAGGADGPGQGPAHASAVRGSWVLSQGRPPGWETAEGLRCEFPDLSSRAARETICRELAVDLYALGAALQAAARRGERIEWAHLALQHDVAGDRHRVVVTEGGDFIAVAVPALAANPVDWVEARRWLRARVQGQTVVATILRATRG